MATRTFYQTAVRDFSVTRRQEGGNTWTFTPVSSAARQWAVDATDFGLRDGKGAYAVLDPFAPEALLRLQEEGFGVRFETQHGQDLIMEAALCLWEAMLEVRAENKAPEWAWPGMSSARCR
ncbi:hypothetical protein V5F40_22630 [Xanthobacter sp. DSM 14520]|uniref:hypothetical protein n=1 Tax=Xanthobacter autotrophicus (strain ATCC BAA-1158 / Py2) TaxID=78245 RepID=UPI00372BD50A